MKGSISFIIWTLSCVCALQADVRMPGIFGENMVLQREVPVKIWGWADPGERVAVSYGAAKASTQADAAGNWEVSMGPFKVAEKPKNLTITAKNTISYGNVVVGDVWICGGQSNMRWPMKDADGGEVFIAKAHNFPHIRLAEIPVQHAAEPQAEFEAVSWFECSQESTPEYSALALYFARELQKVQNDVPIGLILSAVGGSNGKLWVSRDAQLDDLALRRDVEDYEVKMEKWNKAVAWKLYERRKASWKKKAKKAEELGRAIPPEPNEPVHPKDSVQRHGSYYNGMIAPMAGLSIKGMIFYHGQANVNAPEEYEYLFRVLIQDWRNAWQIGDFPFLFVQLANYGKPSYKVMDKRDKLPFLREAQLVGLKEKNTAVVVTTDLGEGREIHPRNKLDVAKRLALAARNLAYEQAVPFKGPRYHFLKNQGSTVVLRFKDLEGGLVAKGADGKLKGFAITGADRNWRWAHAEIIDDAIHVSHPDLPQPIAVRYNWSDNPEGNLYNKAGLPAISFRTDTWVRDSLSKRDREKWVNN